jgi:hypothetical protein
VESAGGGLKQKSKFGCDFLPQFEHACLSSKKPQVRKERERERERERNEKKGEI